MIAQYALVPGCIYPSVKSQLVNYREEKLFAHGCQLLATCRQVYLEGFRIFYGRNTFHLAPGPLSASTQYFAKLNPVHGNLIERVSIDFSINNLTPRETLAIITNVALTIRLLNAQLLNRTRYEEEVEWLEKDIAWMINKISGSTKIPRYSGPPLTPKWHHHLRMNGLCHTRMMPRGTVTLILYRKARGRKRR